MRRASCLAWIAMTLAFPRLSLAQADWVPAINPAFVTQSPTAVPRPYGASAGTIRPNAFGTTTGVPVVSPGSLPGHQRTHRARVHEQESDGITTRHEPVRDGYPRTAVNPFDRELYPVIAGVWLPVTSSRAERDDTPEVYIGMSKADLARILGRPAATVYSAHGQETRYFDTVTIVIRHGVVADIQ